MAWRFSPSKFKNTSPKIPKKEGTIYDLPIGNLSCTNNAIHANMTHLAFLIEGEGGKIGVLPLQARGRRLRGDLHVICAHTDPISDFCFFKFEPLLATCAAAERLKIWSCKTFDSTEKAFTSADPVAAINLGYNRILDCLTAHKTVGGLIAVGSGSNGCVVDVCAEKIVIEINDVPDRAQSLDWSENGSTLIISGDKGRQASIYDPRASCNPVEKISLHAGMGREGRVIFANESIVSSGFTNNRVQEILLYDPRNWTKPAQMESFEPSTGLLIPLYDMDSGLLFLAGKGSCKFTLAEINTQKTLLSRLHEQSLPEQTLGACLMPKKACDVMNGEVQRIHQLTKNSVVPIQCIVPRRSYQNFHDDLFPETIDSCLSNPQEWLAGINKLPLKMSLNPEGPSPPAKISEPVKNNESQVEPSNGAVSNGNMEPRKIHYHDVLVKKQEELAKSASPEDSSDKENTKAMVEKRAEQSDDKSPAANPIPVRMRSAAATNARTSSMQPVVAVQQRRVRPKSCVVGTVQSKFRHVEVIAAEKKCMFINLRNVNNRLPIESNGFCVSERFAAIPLAGQAGSIAILELSHPVKLPNGIIDAIKNGVPITDLQWNPFSSHSNELAVGLENGMVKIWQIDNNIQCIGSKPAEEPKEDSEEVEEGMKLADLLPTIELNVGNGRKVTQIRYNPTASGILAVGVANGAVQIWNLPARKCVLQVNALADGILSLAWSADGLKLASVGRDCMLRVFEPQLGADCCVCERKVLESSRGARIIFVCEDSLLLVVGFSRQSNRQCALYRTNDLHQLVNETVDTSTQPLIPVYDYDTSVLFLTGKGDRTIQMFEVSAEAPHFLRLSPFTGSTGHQAIALQQKNMCAVMDVEFQRGWRLTEKTLEKISFRVPRIKKDLFQRDVFPNALVTWKCLYNAEQWEEGAFNNLNFENLCPVGVQENNTANVRPQLNTQPTPENLQPAKPEHPKVVSIVENRAMEPADLKKQTEQGWSQKITKSEGKLEQDKMEGVDEMEWEEDKVGTK